LLEEINHSIGFCYHQNIKTISTHDVLSRDNLIGYTLSKSKIDHRTV